MPTTMTQPTFELDLKRRETDYYNEPAILSYNGKKFKGVPEIQEMNDWFESFLGKKVLVHRVLPDYLNPLTSRVHHFMDVKDKRRGFVDESPFHLINQSSIEDLRERLEKRHGKEAVQEPNFSLTGECFRPNIVIDTLIPYSEDKIIQYRIKQTLFRMTSYCIRCMTVAANVNTGEHNMKNEPLSELSKYRTHKKYGVLFGTYLAAKVLSKSEFTSVFSDYPAPDFNEIDPKVMRVRVDDKIMVRVEKQLYDPLIDIIPPK